jgi:hypothetical protein
MDLRGKKVRPLKPGEFRQNKDGTRSTELTRSVRHPDINKGQPTNIPSMYVVEGKVVEFPDEDQAAYAAQATGLKYPTYKTMDEAVAAAKKRSAGGGNAKGSIGK